MPELMRVMHSGPSGGGCKMVICWNVNKSIDDLEHHSQEVFSTSGLQGFPLKKFEHGCNANSISISICYIYCYPSLYNLELIDVTFARKEAFI